MQEHIIVYSLDDIDAAAREFLANCDGKKKFAFTGEMGAGKTTFISAICKALGSEDTFTSPTFAVVNQYMAGDGVIHHIDLYRIEEKEDLLNIGIEDYLYDEEYCFIEWPQLIEAMLPEQTVHVNLSVIDNKTRKLIIRYGTGKAA